MSGLSELAARVRLAHEAALARGRPPHIAFEIAAETCRRSNPGLTRLGAERLALTLLRQAGHA